MPRLLHHISVRYPVGTARGLFDWLNGPVMDAGMISPLDPDLVHITDDLNEAVDIALSGLM